MRFFTALVRHGSYSAAARALGVNHATVARRIAALETALGAKLFERRLHGHELTEAGQGALAAAGAMDAAAEGLAHIAAGAPQGGLVRITATPSLADAFLIPRLAAFRASHPEIDVEVFADRRSVSLSRHEADIGLRLARPSDGDLIARHVATIAFGFYADPSWLARLAAGGAPLFVGFDESSVHLPEAVWLAGRFPTARLVFRSNSQLSQAIAARSGCGVALLPCFLGRTEPGLVPIDLGVTPPTRELWLLTRRDGLAASPVRHAREFLIDLFQREKAAFAVAPEAVVPR
ncbi:LysR family transcriptional regulator [Kaistia dalseonensis]|uniref:DNA-binding transcriptional LysR family regulator n=1 Tax=Kaistia dalseonensis TaxID=410840 RepID=A0ABU0HBS4_9HYPH|nr:LysR family transcriptional regulator [Kaistia dalseonensis]MCX5497136.1 LysR family transcriptional regulator [Kaistia dalseonensis]MDQ0439763.1 DNA-binding transcriptional LysR family regulator [Kaistia dalseonensis]